LHRWFWIWNADLLKRTPAYLSKSRKSFYFLWWVWVD
jgi:hypothetical protein